MPRAALTALTVLVAVAIPLVLTGNALWLVLNSWFVEVQYAMPWFPAERAGLGEPLRADLAKTGVASIRPGGEGVSLLSEARLADGRPAFDGREVAHMADVRALVAGALIAWAAALAVALAAGLTLWRLGSAAVLARALRAGALLTLAAIALLGLFMAVAFGAFFDGFHAIFFAGDSWRFPDDSTLLQLYPDSFWVASGAVMVALVALQAAALRLRAARCIGKRFRGGSDRRRRPSSRR